MGAAEISQFLNWLAQDRKVNLRIEIADGLDFEVGHEVGDAFDAVEDCRDDHHGPR